ncbi:MAG: hypothetical protein AAFR33_13930 [Pseudomonadota bacterium]
MKDYIPLAVLAGLLAPAAPALAQDFAAAPGKSRVTLYFQGHEPAPRFEPASAVTEVRAAVPKAEPEPAPEAKTAPAGQSEIRYMTAQEWAVHPSNPARRSSEDGN